MLCVLSSQKANTTNIINNNYPVLPPQDKVFQPNGRNTRFVDRPNVFEAIRHAIENSKSMQCSHIALCGLGGMGKSQIALEYCYRNKTNYRYIFWIDADTEKTVQTSFVEAARMLGLLTLSSTNSAKPEDVMPHITQWFQSNKEWLLVFDNADDYSLGNTSDSFYLQTKYFPNMEGGVILMTTRSDIVWQGGSPIKLNEMRMDNETALKMLLRRPVIVTDVDPIALEIIHLLGHLPLAIDLAGACMEMEKMEPAEFLKSFKEDPSDYLDLSDIQKETGSKYGKTVLTVWKVSFDLIKGKDSLAAKLLESFAFLYPDYIPFALFEHNAKTILALDKAPTRRSLNIAINRLRDFSLVRRTIRDTDNKEDFMKDTVTIHRLVQTVMLLEMESPMKLQWYERVISALSHEVPSESHLYNEHSRRIMEVYVPHIQHVVPKFTELATEQQQHAIASELSFLLLPTVDYLTRQALFDGVEHLAKLAVSSSETANGLEHLDTATALRNLSYFCMNQGNPEAAKPYSKRALEIREKELGLSHKDTLSSRNDLAYIYRSLDMKMEVVMLYGRAALAGDQMAFCELFDLGRQGFENA